MGIVPDKLGDGTSHPRPGPTITMDGTGQDGRAPMGPQASYPEALPGVLLANRSKAPTTRHHQDRGTQYQHQEIDDTDDQPEGRQRHRGTDGITMAEGRIC